MWLTVNKFNADLLPQIPNLMLYKRETGRSGIVCNLKMKFELFKELSTFEN
jgi:hypothetical protein